MRKVERRRPGTTIRCAIYTRKSSDEGLEQEFNSLDAQREACAAFVLSQKHAGWVAVRDLYDDAGLSGGTMERPALQRLLSDIKANTRRSSMANSGGSSRRSSLPIVRRERSARQRRNPAYSPG